jgi:hypothetical protein
MLPYFFILIYIYKHVKSFNKINFYYYNIPNSSEFIDLRLKSGLDLSDIIAEINTILPQFSGFIDQFNSLVTKSNINVITDSSGDMSIDVPSGMSDKEAQNISKRIGIIDRLITTHGNNLNDLFQKGLDIENKLKVNNPNYVSELKDQIIKFRKLNASYKH